MPPRPLKNRVLVLQEPKKERLDSGLYLPENADHALHNNFATVIAKGSTVSEDLKVGDRVLFRRSSDTALMPDPRERSLYAEDWTDLLVLKEDDIIGVVEPEVAS